ncbi:hypothetical protein RND81_05G252500 [Saponaria officinalis]|uniref:Glycine-rich protein n=1 Tax=Saponaria officinalis TaxID=3572 RepID=A0AAW1L266_SAPOF
MKFWVFAFSVLFLQIASHSSTLGTQEHYNFKNATAVAEDADIMHASVVGKRGGFGGGRGGGGGRSGGFGGGRGGGGGHSGGHAWGGGRKRRPRRGGMLPIYGGAGAAAGMAHCNHNHNRTSATSDAYAGLTLPLFLVTIVVSLFYA